MYMDIDDAIKAIRPAIKKVCPKVSVRRGRGTAYCWIEVSPAKGQAVFSEIERHYLAKLTGIQPGANFLVISPESQPWVAQKVSR